MNYHHPCSLSPSLSPSEDSSYNWVLPLPHFLLVFAPKSPNKECEGLSELPINLSRSGPFPHHTYWKTEVRGMKRVHKEAESEKSSVLPTCTIRKSPAEGNPLAPSLLRVSVFGKGPVLSYNECALCNHTELRSNPSSSPGSKYMKVSEPQVPTLKVGLELMLGSELAHTKCLAHGM